MKHMRRALVISLLSNNVTLLASDQIFLPMTPRTALEAGLISGATVIQLDILQPIYGSQNKGIFYLDANAAYDSQGAFLFGPGAGYRGVVKDQLLGGYIFADYSRTDDNGHFWVMNPGVEWITQHWDVRVNGYFPTAHLSEVENLGLASDFGIYEHVSFSGHSGYDQDLLKYAVAGNGADASVGYVFPVSKLRTRVSGGIYYYGSSSNVSSIKGVEAGFEFPVSKHASFVAAGTYDNVFHAKGLLTFRYVFGETINADSSDIGDRLRDLINRNIAAIDTAAGIPTQESIDNSGKDRLTSDDIWFFTQGASAVTSVTRSDCTYENACAGLNQDIIDSISGQDPDGQLYLSPGNYYATPGSTSPATFLLESGLSMWGRESGFQAPGSGSDRAALNGVVKLSGFNTLDSVQVFNNTITDTLVGLPSSVVNVVGIHVLSSSSGGVLLNNVNVVVDDLVSSNGAFDLFIAGNSSVTASNSTFSATENTASTSNGAENIAVAGHNNVTLNNSVLNANDSGNGSAYGFYITPVATATVAINSTTFNTTDSGSAGAFSIYMSSQNSYLTVSNSVLNTQETNAASVSGAIGVVMAGPGPSSAGSTLNLNGTALNVSNAGSGGSFGLYMTSDVGSNAVANVSGSSFNVTDSGANTATGVLVNVGALNIDNTIMHIQEVGPVGTSGAFGIQVFDIARVSLTNSDLFISDNGTNGGAGVYMQAGIAVIDQTNMILTESGSGLLAGVFFNSASATTATMTNSSVTASGTGSGVVDGVASDNSTGTINVDNTSFDLTANTGIVTGAKVLGGATTINITGSDFTNITSASAEAAGVNNQGTAAITSSNTNYVIEGTPGDFVATTSTGTINQSGGTCTINHVTGACP